MGIKLIISENQAQRLDNKLSQDMQEWGGAGLKCTNLDFDKLDAYLGKKERRPLGYETILLRINDHNIAIKHYNTNILRIDHANIITINVSGWETRTTKDRLNTFLRCKNVFISQAKRVWTIHGSNGSFPYEDGMEIHEDGHIVMPSNAKHMYSSDIINKVDKTKIDPKFYELYGIKPDEETQ